MRRASNATFLVDASAPAERNDSDMPARVRAIYKPMRGERPLWDFPAATLYRREVATFVVSEALGWDLIPPTVVRDGPYGPGSLQLFVDADESVDVIDRIEAGDELFRPLAVLDVIVNSADRKASHCLVDRRGNLWGIDNGLTFNVEPKLRTVLWAWMGCPVPENLLCDLKSLHERLAKPDTYLRSVLEELLAPDEADALRFRVAALVADPVFPEPDPSGPAIPWPPY